jgi:hypothetical protein
MIEVKGMLKLKFLIRKLFFKSIIKYKIMDRVLPSNVDYTKILPLAVESRSHRRSFFPTNGQSFTSDGNNIIRIDVSASAFLDPKHSYLRFRFTNRSATTLGFDFGGGHGFLRRLRIEQAGNVLSDCQNYNKLMSAIVLPSQCSLEAVGHRSITEGIRFANQHGASMAPAPPAESTGTISISPAPDSTQITANAGGADTYTFCIPLMQGLLGSTQDKMVPLQLLGSSPVTIEIELAPFLDVGVFNVAPGAGYTIDQVRYLAQLVEVGPEVDAQLRMVQEVSGGRLVLNGVDYTHFAGSISAGATGLNVINVPARRKSMKSLFFVGASQTYGGNQHTFANLSYGGNFNAKSFQMKIGSVLHPATPIEANLNTPAGNRSEVLSELAKCWGTLSSVNGVGVLCAANYATTDCDVAGMAVDVGPGAGPTQSLRFAPFGIDLEAFQRTAIESGVNTADRSLPISLMIDIAAANAQAINVDAFVAYDSLYFIDETGTIRVSM